MQMVDELKRLYSKYIGEQKVVLKSKPHFEEFKTSNEDILLLSAFQEVLEEQGRDSYYLTALYNYFKDNSKLLEADEDAEDQEDSSIDNNFGDEPSADESEDVPEPFKDLEDTEEQDDEELGDNEETFSNKYPQVDEEETLKKVYDEWLDAIKNKPFYKTIEAYYQSSQAGTLNYLDRSFLWKLIKAISSCITHLFIEGEQKEESLCLVDRYYDSLINCLDSVVHANAKEDVANSFLYIVDLLGLIEKDQENDNENEQEEDKF